MKKWLCIFLAFGLLLSAAGCAQEAASNTDPLETNTGKVEDPFVQPPENSTMPENPDTTMPSEQTPSQPIHRSLSYSWLGISEELELGHNVSYVVDEKTTYRYRTYGGGEMCLPFELETEGYQDAGLGVLVFVNGLPQPYRVDEGTEYVYMHIFYPEDGKHYPNLFFIPVTGQKGDNLEVWAYVVWGPEFIPTAAQPDSYGYAAGALSVEQRLQFNATPPAQELPETPNRILSQTVSYENTSYFDTYGWSAEDLQRKISAKFVTPDFGSDTADAARYNISADTPIRLRFEVYGSPLVDYRLVYFLDNVPVAVDAEDLAFIKIESGQKVIVETTVDLSGFDGFSILYPVLVPVNRILTYDGEVQNNTQYLRAQTPVTVVLSAAADYQGMLDMNSK